MRRKKLRNRLLWGSAVILLAMGSLWLPVFAEAEVGRVPDGYGAIIETLPDELTDCLPDGFDGEDTETVGEAVAELTSFSYIWELFSELVGVELGQAIGLLTQLTGLLLFSALLHGIGGSLGSPTLTGALRFCSTTAIFSAIVAIQWEHMRHVQTYFERISALMRAMIPVMGTVWAMGGNVTTATAAGGGLSVFLGVCQHLCAETVMPVSCVCTALALCNTVSPEMGVRGVTSSIRRCYTFSLGLIMTLLLTCLGSQTALSAAADGVAARTAKMVSATVIPTVGGSIGETLRTVGAGVQYLKGVIGIGGVGFLLLLTLPVLLSLLLTRLAFLLGSGIAELLGCEAESRLLGELGTVYGCMIAVVAMTSVTFILALILFVKSVVAVA